MLLKLLQNIEAFYFILFVESIHLKAFMIFFLKCLYNIL